MAAAFHQTGIPPCWTLCGRVLGGLQPSSCKGFKGVVPLRVWLQIRPERVGGPPAERSGGRWRKRSLFRSVRPVSPSAAVHKAGVDGGRVGGVGQRKEVRNGGPGAGEVRQRRRSGFQGPSGEHVAVERVLLEEGEERVARREGGRRARQVGKRVSVTHGREQRRKI